uniref:Uncharacterized protein n=1 Tax=Arundo donax TaxID=35708 RepID=A0A0A9B5T9_ARUDO
MTNIIIEITNFLQSVDSYSRAFDKRWYIVVYLSLLSTGLLLKCWIFISS